MTATTEKKLTHSTEECSVKPYMYGGQRKSRMPIYTERLRWNPGVKLSRGDG